MIILQNTLTGKTVDKTEKEWADMIKTGASRRYNIIGQKEKKKDVPAEVKETTEEPGPTGPAEKPDKKSKPNST